MVDISNAFSTSSESVSEFFQKPGLGFHIPIYQREYSWDETNIEQLMEDISQGVENLLENEDEILFLGTIIRVKNTDPSAIKPLDERALPTRIDHVIDGQQRISTIALLAALLYQRLVKLGEKLPSKTPYEELREEIDGKLAVLRELFSVDLRRGKPTMKPVVIRASEDNWTLVGDDTYYSSDVSAYLASVIRSIDESSEFPATPRRSLVGDNLSLMEQWLDKVASAHEDEQGSNDFPPAWIILDSVKETDIWSYERKAVAKIVNDSDDDSPLRGLLCSLVQLLTFVHFVLDRCCFTAIHPVSEEWAFDMFQSLNATGTPLTAIETFKPMVVNLAGDFQGTILEQYFNQVEALFEDTRTADEKTRLTNEYLTALALAHDGSKLPRRFSSQRKWLNVQYRKYRKDEGREEFVRRMSDLATYLRDIKEYDPTESVGLLRLKRLTQKRKQLVTVCVLYLEDAGHKMARTILSRFYASILRGLPSAVPEFAVAAQTLAAFYTLWRSASSNSGLDDVYRRILRGDEKVGIEALAWEGGQIQIASKQLKTHLRSALEDRGLGSKDDWKRRAMQYFRFNTAKPICRFALFLTSEATMPDESQPGLMVKAAKERPTYTYLNPGIWKSSYYTLEHVAPQRPGTPSNWDPNIYAEDGYQSVGNLTLLPGKVNRAVGNREWEEKWIYYQFLAEQDSSRLEELEARAKDVGVELREDTVELLKGVEYSDHIVPIIEVGESGSYWDQKLIEARAERICDLLWEEVDRWLS